MGVEAWRALTWWEQRLLIEGLQEEFSDPDGAAAQTQNNTVAMNGIPGEFQVLGLRERTL